MSRFAFDDYLEEDPMFTPCIHCGCLDFYMDWEETIYKCVDCDKPIDSQSTSHNRKGRDKPKVRKFKDEDV